MMAESEGLHISACTMSGFLHGVSSGALLAYTGYIKEHEMKQAIVEGALVDGDW